MSETKRRCDSAVSNGSRLFMAPTKVTGASAVARRYRDLLRAVEKERGGRDAMGVVQHEAARVYVGLACRLEQLHADMASGKAVDPEALGQLGDRLDRAARRMGPVKAAERANLLDRLAKRGNQGAAA